MKSLWTLAFFTFTCLCVAAPGAAHAQAPGTPIARYDLRDEAFSYAQEFGVDFHEAVRRLALQAPIGTLRSRLASEERGAFADLWIEHAPEFRVVVQITDPQGRQRIDRYIRGGALAGLVEVRQARWSLARLEADQAAARSLVQRLGLRLDSGLNVRENRVELYTLDPAALERSLAAAGLELPESVAVVQVEALSRPVNMYGGLPLSTCTTGFSIRNWDGTLGILTAGHCPNSQSYSVINLPFQGEACGNGYDVQWHTSPWDERGWFWAGQMHGVTGTRSRDAQSVGEYVCKQGMTTGLTCGTIQDRSFQPSYYQCSPHTPTYIRVSAGGANLVDGGDSGGPVFVGDTAYGITICEIFYTDLCYMAIDFVSALGVTVRTDDPYPPPPPTCEEQCWLDYDDCRESYCYWDYDEYMCHGGCDARYNDCLTYC